MKLYLMVTKDKYELPTGVYDSIEEMAEKNGLKVSTIHTQLSKYKHKTVNYYIPYRRVEIDDEETLHDDNEG